MNTLAGLINFLVYVLQLLIWVIIIQAVLSWLIAFNVVNMRNRFVAAVYDGLDRVLAPILQPIRRRLPDLGGIDVSPLVVILAIVLAQQLLQGLRLDLLAN
ncbi:YggT family protein [Thermaurantiacus sp.]